MCDLGAKYRDGLPGASHADGQPVMTNLRRITADSGSAFVTAATAALAVQGAGLLYVSFAAQYAFILSEKPGQRAASVIEALMLDTGMIIFSFLALGLAKKGLSSRAERALIMVCAGLSAAMNYAASDTASWRSVAVFVIARCSWRSSPTGSSPACAGTCSASPTSPPGPGPGRRHPHRRPGAAVPAAPRLGPAVDRRRAAPLATHRHPTARGPTASGRRYRGS